MQAQQYFADANEADSWMREKEPVVGNTDYGKDEDSAEALLKKHEALMSDLDAYGTVVEQLKEQAQQCKVYGVCCTTLYYTLLHYCDTLIYHTVACFVHHFLL